MDWTIERAIKEMACTAGNRMAFIDAQQAVSYRQAENLTGTIAAELRHRGARKGQRIGILLPRSVTTVALYLGAMRAGLEIFPLRTDFFSPGNRDILPLDPQFLCTADQYLPLVRTWAQSSGWMGQVLPESGFIGALRDNATSTVPEDAPARPDETTYYNVTSGTSGRPKFAVTTHANLYWNTHATHAAFMPGPDDAYLCLFPIDLHPHEHFMRSLVSGCTTVLVESRNPRILVEAIRYHKVRWLKAAPVMLDLIARHLLRDREPPLDLRFLEISGATNRHQLQQWQPCFHGEWVRVWGSTETTGIAFVCRGSEVGEENCLGRAMAGYEAAIWDDDGRPQADGTVGRLMVRGQAVVAGYRTRDHGLIAFPDGQWYHTGDLAYRDARGQFLFCGRAREIVKSAGIKVFTGHIEAFLQSRDGVREAAVVKIEDREREEIAVGFAVVSDEEHVTGPQLLKLCRQDLPGGAALRRLYLLRRLPLTAAGKPDYVRLTAEAAERMQNEKKEQGSL